jgi:hypothetical protein
MVRREFREAQSTELDAPCHWQSSVGTSESNPAKAFEGLATLSTFV